MGFVDIFKINNYQNFIHLLSGLSESFETFSKTHKMSDNFTDEKHLKYTEVMVISKTYENSSNVYLFDSKVEAPGIDPGTSRMLSERSTI